jgi:HNH endonuclease
MERICTISWCADVHYAHGLCHMHYQRDKRGVDMDQPRLARNAPAAERFWTKVDKEWDCWPWLGYLNEDGYGSFRESNVVVYAHRFVYELLVGPIPDSYDLDHLCGYRDCCDPSHMEPVTHAENSRRAWERKKDLVIA